MCTHVGLGGVGMGGDVEEKGQPRWELLKLGDGRIKFTKLGHSLSMFKISHNKKETQVFLQLNIHRDVLLKYDTKWVTFKTP